jgi:hypothetical protein
MLYKRKSAALVLGFALGSVAAQAKPIAFADGTTLMHERNTNMLESQAFYAPTYWWSAGPGFIRLTSDDKQKQREIGYAQFNYLVKRWNLSDAQGNVFAFAGVGKGRSTDTGGPLTHSETVWRYGAQGDYETRSLYTSFKTDGYRGSRFSHRIDTLQLGIAPYEHDYDDLATWFVLQFRNYTGGLRDESVRKLDQTAILRLFKGPIWVELGINRERHSQFMIMYNF